MVAAGIGVTVLPVTAVPEQPPSNSLLRYLPFEGRCRNAAWCWPGAAAFRDSRRSRLAQAVYECGLPGVQMLAGEVTAEQD